MKYTQLLHRTKGFTLIELLIVIAIIGILAAVVIIAVNPGRQLAQANNSQRRSDANATLNSLGQFAADNAGLYPDPITGLAVGTNSVIGTCAAGATCTAVANNGACVDIITPADLLAVRAGNQVLIPTYISAMPNDPQAATATETKYYVSRDVNNRITVGACEPQLGETIAITR